MGEPALEMLRPPARSGSNETSLPLFEEVWIEFI